MAMKQALVISCVLMAAADVVTAQAPPAPATPPAKTAPPSPELEMPLVIVNPLMKTDSMTTGGSVLGGVGWLIKPGTSISKIRLVLPPLTVTVPVGVPAPGEVTLTAHCTVKDWPRPVDWPTDVALVMAMLVIMQ